MFKDPIAFLTDSYKVTHWPQYPPGTERVSSYFESRGGEFKETVFFGLQYLVKEYLAGKTFTSEDVLEAEEFYGAHLGPKLFNKAGWNLLFDRYNGKLPISIKAVAEGTVVPVKNVLMTVENTDPDFHWLTNYVETLLVQLWYPITVATLSREIKKVIHQYLTETGDPSLLPFKLHDFGFRGVSSVESAAIGGAAHLVNFMGTDTLAGIRMLQKYYKTNGMPGFSIPASEHSTITSWGRENEAQAYNNMLDQYPEGLVACVSDSYDIHGACANIWGDVLKEKVLARKGTLVVRPDSGYPPKIVCEVLEILGEKFGFTLNEKGYKVLHPNVRVIQGDGVDYDMIKTILGAMKDRGWSADNIAFGMGGALLQKLHRDTQKMAFKCSNVTVNGEDRDVYKDPATDPGKQSKKGKLALILDENGYRTVNAPVENDQLVEVFRDGEILKEYNLDEIRERAKI